MNSRWFLVLVVLSIWLNNGHGAPIGQDVCNCQSTIIRTPKISVPTPGFRVVCTKTPGPQQYSPISNPCSCVNTRVTPAYIPRVDCDLTAATPAPSPASGAGCTDGDPKPFGERGSAFSPAVSDPCDATAGSAYAVSQDPPGPDGIDEPAAGNACNCGAVGPVAVDPVSLMLAQAEANRCRSDVREDRLAFGPVAVPKDAIPSSPAVPDVNEEGLYALDKAIVELKTCKRFGQASALASDTDALLALEEDAQLDDDAGGPEVTLPSYADVGYQPETPSCAPLIGGVSVPAATFPKPTVVYDATATAAVQSPAMDTGEYSPRYCTCGNTSPQWQCSSCKSSSYGTCSCGKSSSSYGTCSCGKAPGGKCSCGKSAYY